jgi:hypothetical protein
MMKRLSLSARTRGFLHRGGAWVPSPLALTETGRMREDWQRLLTLYYIRSGACTVIPGAHTGEFAGGDLQLYKRWLQIVRQMTAQHGEQMFLMAAVGGKQARRQAELAAREEFDLIMVAPTAFTGLNDDEVLELMRELAGIIPVFAFELQRAIPGSRAYSLALWERLFEIVEGAKGASFDTYRSQLMLEAAARSERREELVLATGNDDRIVYDLGGVFPFRVGDDWVRMKYQAGLLGHFATDTRAAVRWSARVMKARDDGPWELPMPGAELAHLVNMCNGALFDALHDFENSVWGVKCRLTQLGLLPEPVCFEETGRTGMAEAIRRAYDAHPVLNDVQFVREHLTEWKREAGV